MSTASDTVNTVPDLKTDRVGQATAIEQSRAVAEVQAAIIVAQRCPRSLQLALTAMRESCSQMGLAERAFFRFPRAGGTISGPSVHLARELARCWGNIQYGVSELRRDDEHGQSEMQAYAWDVQTNTRSMQVFVVPHKRDKKGGPERLTDMRDIYENNANNGARRLREVIYSILPPWFVEEAKEIANKTIVGGGGVPLPTRVANAVTHFESLGIVADRLEQKIERPRDKWTEHDLAQLMVIFKSLQRGEVTAEDEFPQTRVTVAEITQGGKVKADQVATDDPLAEPAAAAEGSWPETPAPGRGGRK